MSFYFRARNSPRWCLQFAAPASLFQQLRAPDAAQSEGQNFLDQRIDLTRPPPRDLADHFLDSSQDAKCRNAGVAGTYHIHLHSQVQGALNGVSDTLIEFQNP